MYWLESEKEEPCKGCGASLVEPYIRCAECGPSSLHLCLYCFGKGLETGAHESNHKYEVIKNDFPLHERSWTAKEEKMLVDAVSDCGLGNWQEIAAQLKTKHWRQCEKHFYKYFVENPRDPLPKFPEANITVLPCPVPFKVGEDPPRPAEGSVLQAELSGYTAARGDFSVEHENFAESDLRDVEFTEGDSAFDQELKLAVVDVYQNILRERQRRKKIIKDYGLINIKRQGVYARRFERTLGPLLMDALRPMYKCVPPMEFDKYLESLHYEAELRQDIKKLQEYRDNGVTRILSAKLYSRLKADRDEERSKRNLLTDVISNIQSDSATQQWIQKHAMFENLGKAYSSTQSSANRRSAPPLDIIGLPGYERLNDRERKLCSTVRLVPESYLEFKRMLVAECTKLGCLKLAQARSMIKIDVNKTRKIYDFLVQEGDLNKDPLN